MAKLEFAYPIEAVHGKLKGSFGAAKRNTANADGEKVAYSVCYGKRNLELHPVTEQEQARRVKFKAIQAIVAARQTNATKRVQDAAAFEAQSAIPTLKKYVWSVAKAEYLASLVED